VNAQIQDKMNRAQRRWFISLLEEHNGVLPNISQESYDALMLAWFREAVYSITQKSIHSAWKKCGLLLVVSKEGGKKEGSKKVVFLSSTKAKSGKLNFF
jgi:hypothetical protein